MKELKLKILFKWLILLIILFLFYLFGLSPCFIKTNMGANTMVFMVIFSLPLSIIFGNWVVVQMARKILFKNRLIKLKNTTCFLIVISVLICAVLFYSYIDCPRQFAIEKEFFTRGINNLFLFYFLNCVLISLFILTKKEKSNIENNTIKKIDRLN